MSDDIVTRLRATSTNERPLWRGEMIEAADEIEHLRIQNEMLLAVIGLLKQVDEKE